MPRILRKEWRLTNGDFEIELCETCRQPVYEGHVDCTCPTNHPDNCDRPTYEVLANAYPLAEKLAEALGYLRDAVQELPYTGTSAWKQVDEDMDAASEALAAWKAQS